MRRRLFAIKKIKQVLVLVIMFYCQLSHGQNIDRAFNVASANWKILSIC